MILGCDVYTISACLNDWSDEDSIKILSSVHRAMSPQAKLLIIEPIIPEGNGPHFGKGLDSMFWLFLKKIFFFKFVLHYY